MQEILTKILFENLKEVKSENEIYSLVKKILKETQFNPVQQIALNSLFENNKKLLELFNNDALINICLKSSNDLEKALVNTIISLQEDRKTIRNNLFKLNSKFKEVYLIDCEGKISSEGYLTLELAQKFIENRINNPKKINNYKYVDSNCYEYKILPICIKEK